MTNANANATNMTNVKGKFFQLVKLANEGKVEGIPPGLARWFYDRLGREAGLPPTGETQRLTRSQARELKGNVVPLYEGDVHTKGLYWVTPQ
jgi:hypothetical protein